MTTRVTPGQLILRAVSLVGAGVLMALPSAYPLTGATAVAVLVTALFAITRPEWGTVLVLVVATLHLLVVDLTGALALVAAAALLAQLVCLTLSASAPPRARPAPALVRRWAMRWVGLVAVAALTWAALAVLALLPGVTAPVALAVTLLALAAVTAGVVVMGRAVARS
ncbi:MAG: hypothetical protein Q4G43_08585 [Mobilicoccus sp.]|nr:hypothetical protein [Mobilicoccus sp.]